jgi:hypothetical protein
MKTNKLNKFDFLTPAPEVEEKRQPGLQNRELDARRNQEKKPFSPKKIVTKTGKNT